MRVLLVSLILSIFALNAAEARHHHSFWHPHHRHVISKHHFGQSLAGTYAPLAAKISEITSSCRTNVISTVRPGARVAGTNKISEHSNGHAVDVSGDYSCVYAHLKGWRGGYSIDPGKVGHVHISLGGREDGIRFAHGGGSHHHSHYAHHRSNRYVNFTSFW